MRFLESNPIDYVLNPCGCSWRSNPTSRPELLESDEAVREYLRKYANRMAKGVQRPVGATPVVLTPNDFEIILSKYRRAEALLADRGTIQAPVRLLVRVTVNYIRTKARSMVASENRERMRQEAERRREEEALKRAALLRLTAEGRVELRRLLDEVYENRNSPNYRVALLAYLEGKTTNEIMQMTGMQRDTVYKNKQRALSAIYDKASPTLKQWLATQHTVKSRFVP